MTRISQMNGQPLTWFSYANFGVPTRRTQVGRHISRETAERAVRKMRRIPTYGQLWIEDAAGNRYEVR